MTQCAKCKRRATMRLQGYGWMCTFHFNRLIRELRTKRNLEKARKRQQRATP